MRTYSLDIPEIDAQLILDTEAQQLHFCFRDTAERNFFLSNKCLAVLFQWLRLAEIPQLMQEPAVREAITEQDLPLVPLAYTEYIPSGICEKCDLPLDDCACSRKPKRRKR